MAIERCRIWWPRQELQLEQGPVSGRLILFGWLFTGAGSLDIVVSAAVPQDQILGSFATLDALQTIVLSSNKRMPVSLQESATFTPGQLEEYCSTKQLPLDTQFVQKEHFGASKNNVMIGSIGNGDHYPRYDQRRWGYDCCVLDGFLDACRKSAVKEGSWVHFFCKSEKSFKGNLNQVPVCHLYFD
ncbi:unnamed protein product [Urochloa humidicola]